MSTPSEKTQAKAAEYLLSGRVKVTRLAHDDFGPTMFNANVSSATQEGDPYRVKWGASGWACDCPAHVPLCAHVLACQAITDFENPDPLAAFSKTPQSIDDFLEGL